VLINVNYAETIFQQMTSAHHFIYISRNIFEFVSKVNLLETRHLGFQFKHKNETIPIRIEKAMIF